MICKNCEQDVVATKDEWVEGWGKPDTWEQVWKSWCCECNHDRMKNSWMDEEKEVECE